MTRPAGSEAMEELHYRESNGNAVSLLWSRRRKTRRRPWIKWG